MRRFLPVIVVVLVAAIAVLWIQFGRRSAAPVAPGQAAVPLAPKAPYLATVDQFMGQWMGGNGAAMYGLLSERMKALVSEAEFIKLVAEVKLSNPRLVAHTAGPDVAYVIQRVDAVQPSGAPAVSGYSLLLKREQDGWKVALFVAEEKVAAKYEDLKLAPGKDKGYVVTYQDEKGQIATVNLQEL